METAFNAASGRYQRVVADAPRARSPAGQRARRRHAGGVRRLGPGRRAQRDARPKAVGARLAAGEQTLLLLNRRGYATSVLCRQCGHILECPNCSVSLTVHRRAHGPSRAVCHYCNYSMRVPAHLRQVRGAVSRAARLRHRSCGDRGRAPVPGIRAGRVDRDTMQKRGAIQEVLARFGRGELDLLVGTQMIAKGHDFPQVTLVGVVSADFGLGLADFRAAERTFQLLTQVAGRAGRGGRRARPSSRRCTPTTTASDWRPARTTTAFYTEELRYRQAMAYPPAVGLISLVVRGRTYGEAMRTPSDLGARLQREAQGALCAPGASARAARQAARRVPRADVPEDAAPHRDARRRPRGARCAAGPSPPRRRRCRPAGDALSEADEPEPVTLFPDEVEQLDRRRREADREHHEREDGEQEPRRGPAARPRPSPAGDADRQGRASRRSTRSRPSSSETGTSAAPRRPARRT